jgi:hypothetical protein
MTTRRRLVWALAIVLGVPAALYGLGWAYVVAVPRADDLRHRLPFDAEAWKSHSADDGPEWPTRLRMVDSLVDRRQLDGLTRERVEQLLGPADRTSKWRDWDLVYHLGPERGLIRIDSEWLVIRFDARGAVAAYRIVRD